MRRRFLSFLATFAFRYAWLMLTLIVTLTAGSVWLALRMNFDTSLVAFLPADASHDENIGEIVSDTRKLEPVRGVIRAKEAGHAAELISVARELVRLLDDPRFFATPVYKVDELAQSYYGSLSNKRLIQLLTPADWAELKRLMSERISEDRLRRLRATRLSAFVPPRLLDSTRQDPLGALETIRQRLAASHGPIRLATHDGYFLSPDQSALTILLYPVLSPENGRDAARTLHFLDDSRDFLFEKHAAWRKVFDIDFSGSLVTTARQLRRMEDDQKLILSFALPLMALLVLLVFRKVEAIFFILVPPVVGLAWTLGLATLVFGGIASVTALLLLIILAIGLQYSVHLYHRFILELYRSHNYYRALSRAYVETGRGILASAVVVALLFFFICVAALRGVEDWRGLLHILRDSRGYGQLGLVAGLGILCNLSACLLALPMLAAIKHALARGRIKPVHLYRFGLKRFYGPALDNPRATVGILLLVCVFFGYHARDLDFYPRFASITPFFLTLESRPRPDVADKAGYPQPGRPIIAVVRGRTWQETLERNDQLYQNLCALGEQSNMLCFDSLRTVLPSLRSQKASLDTLNRLDLEPFRRAIDKVSRSVGLKPVVYEPFLEALAALKEMALNPDSIEFDAAAGDSLISAVQRTMTHKDNTYYVATAIYPRAGGFAPAQLGRLSAALRQGLAGLTLIGDPLIERDLSRLIKVNLAVMILMSIFVIWLALLLHFHSIRFAWLTFLPVVAEVIWLCGMMAIMGLQIHFFTLLAMPLILCLAMDNALQLAQFYRDRQPCSVRHAMVSLGRVVMLSCGLMVLLYGTLALAYYPAVRNFGAVVIYGAAGVSVGTVMLLPALLQLYGRGQPLLETLIVESDV